MLGVENSCGRELQLAVLLILSGFSKSLKVDFLYSTAYMPQNGVRFCEKYAAQHWEGNEKLKLYH